MQPCVELAPPVELVPSAGGAQDPDRLSVSPKHPLQIVARARAFLQRLVDSVGLLLVGRQQASIPRVQEIEDGQGALRVASLGLPELWQRHRAKLGTDSGVPLLSAPSVTSAASPSRGRSSHHDCWLLAASLRTVERMKLSAKFARQESEAARQARIARRRIRGDRVAAIRQMLGLGSTDQDEPPPARRAAAKPKPS